MHLSDSEAGYLASYYSVALKKHHDAGAGKRMLILTQSRRSETFMLKYSIQQHFGDRISRLDVLPSDMLRQALASERYDGVFTTGMMASYTVDDTEIRKINFFVTGEDYQLIEQTLFSRDESDSLENVFRPQLFFHIE